MNDTLKVAGRIGAELGAAKAEVERLRELLRDVEFRGALTGWEPGLIGQIAAALAQQADHVRDAAQMMVPSEILKAIAWGDRDDAAEAIGSLRCLLADPEGEDEIAFPDSPEPTDTFTAVDMATAAAQAFRDGQAAGEPAPAQDEQEVAAVIGFYEGEREPRLLSWNVLPNGEHRLYTRPAQTEQQPSTDALINGAKALLALDESGSLAPHGIGGLAREVIEKLIVRVEQTAPQGKFRMGDLVKKSTGSEWVGHVCGWYSTNQTPEGYAVESSAHRNSVQIYPAKALEAVE